MDKMEQFISQINAFKEARKTNDTAPTFEEDNETTKTELPEDNET